MLLVCVYLAEFGDTRRQRDAIWRILCSIENATQCRSIGNKPLIFVAGDFNGADTTPLCLALQLHQVNKDPTHKRGRTLDLRLANAPRCYVSETWAPLHDDHNNRSDHFVILSYPPESKYKATLAPLCTKSIPKKMNTNRLKL